MGAPEIVYPIGGNDIEQVLHCAVCNGRTFRTISNVSAGGVLVLSTDYCVQCGFVFRGRRPKIEWFEESWKTRDRREGRREDLQPDDLFEQFRYRRYANLAGALEQIGCGKTVLDIGTGPGNGLRAFVDRGWKVVGIEPDPARAKVGRDRGLDIVETKIESYRPAQGGFDVVTVVHTLEHLHDPLAMLSHAAKCAKDSGHVYVEVPDVLKFARWEDSLYLEHMSNFSTKTLVMLSAQAGLVPRYRFYPKTYPFGGVHLGFLFQVDRGRDSGRPASAGSGPGESFEEIRRLYTEKLPGVPPEGVLSFAVDAINDVGYTYQSEGSTLHYDAAAGAYRFSPVEGRTKLGALSASLRALYGRMKVRIATTLWRDSGFYNLRYEPLS